MAPGLHRRSITFLSLVSVLRFPSMSCHYTCRLGGQIGMLPRVCSSTDHSLLCPLVLPILSGGSQEIVKSFVAVSLASLRSPAGGD